MAQCLDRKNCLCDRPVCRPDKMHGALQARFGNVPCLQLPIVHFLDNSVEWQDQVTDTCLHKPFDIAIGIHLDHRVE